MPRESTRRPALDGLRALAALGVVAHHAWQYSGHPTEVLGIWWEELALGVPLFFCLSGFLVYAPWARAAIDPAASTPRLGRFYALRAARILPLYYLTLVVAVLLLHGTGSPRLVEDGRLLGFVVLAQNSSPELAGMLNPPTWSLAVEVAFYAVLPLIGWLVLTVGRARPVRSPRPSSVAGRSVCSVGIDGRSSGHAAAGRPAGPDRSGRRGLARVRVARTGRRGLTRVALRAPRLGRTGQLVALTALAGASVAWSAVTDHTATSPVIRTILPDVLGLFCVGMAARVLVEGRTIPRWLAHGLLVAGVALVWAHGSGHLGAPLGGHLVDLPAAVGFAAICVACSTLHAPRWLGSRPLTYLGARSYGIYLWHYPILLGLQARGLLPADDVWATTALVGTLAILASVLSWRLVEEPVLNATRRRLGRTGGRTTVPGATATPRPTGRPRVTIPA